VAFTPLPHRLQLTLAGHAAINMLLTASYGYATPSRPPWHLGCPNGTFASSFADGSFAVSLVALSVPPTAGGTAFILAGPERGPTVKSGYTMSIGDGVGAILVGVAAGTCNALTAKTTFHTTAVPVTVGNTGQRSFASDSKGTICFLTSGMIITPRMGNATGPIQ
jgi:hypothetical protein